MRESDNTISSPGSQLQRGGDYREPPRYRSRASAGSPLQTLSTRRRSPSGLAAVLIVAVLLLLVAGGATAWATLMPITIRVDGAAVRVPPRSTFGEAVKSGAVKLKRGTLHAVDGSVITSAPGPAGVVTLNGRPANAGDKLRPGDRLTRAQGVDATESVLSREVAVPFRTVERGFGDGNEIVREGKDGVKVEEYGEVSGIVLSTKFTLQPVHKIVDLGGATRAKKGDRVVALTFDDGPWGDQTIRILDILDKYDIKATFFMLGNRVKREPKIVAEVAKRGHLLGNHSYSHPNLRKATDAELNQQIEWTSAGIEKAAGKRPHWFRAPGGLVNKKVRAAVEADGMSIAHWDIGTGDWSNKGSGKVISTVMAKLRPGAVILLHDGGGKRDQTIEALPVIIEKLEAEGYRFVTLDQLPYVPGAGTQSY